VHLPQENGERRVKIVHVDLKNWKRRKMQWRENYLLSFWEKMSSILQYRGNRVVVEVVDWEMRFDVLDVCPLSDVMTDGRSVYWDACF
jgi:hypothetical protein